MSKLFVPFFLILTIMPSSVIPAQDTWTPPELTVIIQIITVDGKSLAVVNGFFRPYYRRPEFRKSFSLANLARGRTPQNILLQDKENRSIKFREIADREYLADEVIESWRYVVDLSPLGDATQAAHSSWLKGDDGILMMHDLWPVIEPRGAVVGLVLPNGWIVTDKKLSEDSLIPRSKLPDGGAWYSASRDTIFGVGKGWRQTKRADLELGCDVAISGEWSFLDDEAVNTCHEVLNEYKKQVFGNGKFARVLIAKFPVSMRAGEWQAETRGNTVTIISSDMPFKQQSIQRLHEQLRHELFHLWIPNGVNLSGNYDWFYEGFALYESLKLAVGMNRIRFADFLDTLSRAHTIDSAQSQGRVSLIDASANRFSGANTQVYARGMLVAFLVDLTMLEKSKGKRSVEDVIRELYAKHRKPTAPVDGNKAVVDLLEANLGVGDIVKKYVAGTDKI